MFWKPHGKPINLLTVENGQYVEGWTYPRYRRKKLPMKQGHIRIEKNTYDNRASVYLEQFGKDKYLIGRRVPQEDTKDYELNLDFAVGCKLYDGDLTKTKKSRMSQSGILGRMRETFGA